MDNKVDDIPSLITIYDVNGREIYRAENIANRIEINLSNQSKGTYVLKIQVGESIREWKIIKM